MNPQNQKQETPKAKDKKQSLNGKEESSQWEKAAEMIAGNNQLMSTLLKLLLSPFTLLAGVGLIVYLFIKNKSYKDEISKLKEENKKLTDEKLLLIEESSGFRKKYKQIKKVLDVEQNQVDQKIISQAIDHKAKIHNVNKNKITYLR